MWPIEEGDVLLHCSRGGEKVESEVETESVVESVVRGEKDESGSGGVEEGGAGLQSQLYLVSVRRTLVTVWMTKTLKIV